MLMMNPDRWGFCAACPVDVGTCPRCGTIWTRDDDGERLGEYPLSRLRPAWTTGASGDEHETAAFEQKQERQ